MSLSTVRNVAAVAVLPTISLPLRTPLVLRRRLQSDAPDGNVRSAEIIANMFENVIASHERQILTLREDVERSRKDLDRARKEFHNDITLARVDLATAVTDHLHINEGLRTQLERSRNNLNLRSAIEIITTTLKERQKSLKVANPVQGAGVQSVVDAIARGGFDNGNITFQDAQNAVIKKIMTQGGIKTTDVGRALGVLYEEISKHHHGGVTESVTVRHGEQTLAEGIAAMSIILFARWVYGSDLDAIYYDAYNQPQFALSTL